MSLSSQQSGSFSSSTGTVRKIISSALIDTTDSQSWCLTLNWIYIFYTTLWTGLDTVHYS